MNRIRAIYKNYKDNDGTKRKFNIMILRMQMQI